MDEDEEQAAGQAAPEQEQRTHREPVKHRRGSGEGTQRYHTNTKT